MKSSSKPYICCGLTPCIQRILEFECVGKGRVNRVVRTTVAIGGKGANTARMIKQLGGTPLLVEFAGGANGRLLEDMLVSEDIAFRHVEVDGETRICQTLVESGTSETTELVEEMPPITADDWQRMLALLTSLDFSEAVVPVSGKLPAGAPVDAYAQLCRLAKQQNGRVILDTVGKPLLAALANEPAIVKINDAELLQTMESDDVTIACHEVLKRGARAVLITRGSRSAFYLDESRSLEIFPPALAAVNPVGSGDAVTAGLTMALRRGKVIEEALVDAMACGGANALNLLSGDLRLEDVGRLRDVVRIKGL